MEIPDVTPGGVIATNWGNQIRDRAVMRYANAATRDASVPVPISGDLAWLQDVNELTIYDGASWSIIGPTPAPASVLINNLTLTAGTGVNQLVAQLTGLNTAKWRYLFTASANVETALTGSMTVTWKMALRSTLPSTFTIHEVDTRNYVNDTAYRGVLAVTGLSPLPGQAGNAVDDSA